jgi:hypothetical protein
VFYAGGFFSVIGNVDDFVVRMHAHSIRVLPTSVVRLARRAQWQLSSIAMTTSPDFV